MDNKAILLRAIAAFNEVGSRDGYFQLYAEHAVLHRSPPLAPGKEAIKQWYRLLWNAFPDSHLTLGNVIAEGEFVANNFRLGGTHRGTFRPSAVVQVAQIGALKRSLERGRDYAASW
jgi:SnoaL-like polyketide cyclase.